MRTPIQQAAHDKLVAEKEVEGALILFEAALMSGDAGRLNAATEAAHAAFQRQLDAMAGLWANAVRDVE